MRGVNELSPAATHMSCWPTPFPYNRTTPLAGIRLSARAVRNHAAQCRSPPGAAGRSVHPHATQHPPCDLRDEPRRDESHDRGRRVRRRRPARPSACVRPAARPRLAAHRAHHAGLSEAARRPRRPRSPGPLLSPLHPRCVPGAPGRPAALSKVHRSLPGHPWQRGVTGAPSNVPPTGPSNPNEPICYLSTLYARPAVVTVCMYTQQC